MTKKIKSLKIYFACSIKGEPGGLEDKLAVIKALKALGHTVLSEQFTEVDPNLQGGRSLGPEEVYERDMKWVKEADAVVADVTRLSLGVGYEMGWAASIGRKVIALCKEDRKEALTWMVKGNTEPNFSVHSWNDESELLQILTTNLGDANV